MALKSFNGLQSYSNCFGKQNKGGEKVKARYRVHRFDVLMRTDEARFEQFLNSLEGEVISVIPYS